MTSYFSIYKNGILCDVYSRLSLIHVICLRFLILYFLFWPTKFRLLLKGSPGSSSAYFSQLEKNVDLRFFFKSVFQIFRKLYRNNRNEFRLTHFLKLSIEIFWIGLSHPLIEKNHSREKFRNYSSNKNRGPPFNWFKGSR